MKIISAVTFLIIAMSNNSFQTNPEEIISGFVTELKENQISNMDLLNKYYFFRKSITQTDKKGIIFPILNSQLDLLRQKLNEDCSKLEIIKHDDQYDIVKLYKLKYSNFNKVYYITCNDSIATPVLVYRNKILSFSIYSKTKNGTKGFIIF